MVTPPTVTISGSVLSDQCARLAHEADRNRTRRFILGIAGIPGSGKSTLAESVLRGLGASDPGQAVIVPLDGFHLPNRTLDALHLRDRKGAPETFDADGFLDLLRQARDATRTLAFPRYDRGRHEPVWSDALDQRIGPATRLIIAEGNYLLLKTEPWAQLAQVLDESWLLETPLAAARHWILARHVRGGRTPRDARAHYERTDLPNARLVLQSMREPDLCLRWPAHPDPSF